MKKTIRTALAILLLGALAFTLLPAVSFARSDVLLNEKKPEPVEYTVSFSPNWPPALEAEGAQPETAGEMEPVTVKVGDALELPENAFVCSYTDTGSGKVCTPVFSGWAAAEESAPVYADGASLVPKADLTLYATWDVKEAVLVKTEPVGNTLPYNGSEQEIITPGATDSKDNTMLYRWYDSKEDKTGHTSDAPLKAKNAGVYSLEYGYMKGDSFVSLGSVKGTVTAAALTVVPGKLEKTYGDAETALEVKSLEGAAEGESPMYEGALLVREEGEKAGEYPVSLGKTAKLTDNGSFMAANYMLAPVEGAVFTIVPRDISDSDVEINVAPEAEYNGGAPVLADIQAQFNGAELVPGTDGDYTTEYSGNTELGTAAVVIAGTGSFTGSTAPISFSVVPKDISSGVSIDPIADAGYTGEPVEPELRVVFTNTENGIIELIKDTDYSVQWQSEHTNPGTVSFTLTGINNYCGTLEDSFNISAIELVQAPAENPNTVIQTVENTLYTGEPVEPELKVVFNAADNQDVELEQGIDYSVEWQDDHTNAGEVEYTVTGAGNYGGTLKGSLTVDKLEPAAEHFTVTVPEGCVSDGTAHTAQVTLNSPCTGCDFKVLYKAAGGKTLEEPVAAGEYEIVIRVLESSRNFMPGTVETGKRIELREPAKDISSGCAIDPVQECVYTGSPIEPELRIVYTEGDIQTELVKDTDYSIVWPENHTDAGTVVFTVNGMGDYTGTLLGSYVIAKAEPTAEIFTITLPEDCEYDKLSHTAEVSLSSPYTGCNITVTYINALGETVDKPVSAGEYSIVVRVLETSANFSMGSVDTLQKLTIAQRTLKIYPTPSTKTYGSDDPTSFTYDAEGILEGDDIKILLKRVEGEGPGEYKVRAFSRYGLDKDNYKPMVYARTVLIIEPPVFLSGENGEHTRKSGQNLTFRISGYAEKVSAVLVDGKKLGVSDYTVASGSTVLTLKSAYLDTLAVGDYKVAVEYTDSCPAEGGMAETSFQVEAPFHVLKAEKESTDPKKPKTGDESGLELWLGMTLLSAAGLAALTTVYIRRKRTWDV